MAETTKGRCQPCWEISISLHIDRKVTDIFERLTTEIATLRGKLKDINFPGNLLGRSWKLSPKMKLFVFSNRCEDVDHFLEWNLFKVSSKKGLQLGTRHEIEQALRQAREDNYVVLPIALISMEDINNLQNCLENISHLNLSDMSLVLPFPPNAKKELQAVLKQLQLDLSENIPLAFTERDPMFCGFMSRKIKGWMFQNCKNILESSQSWLEDLMNVPTCSEVENCLNRTLEEINAFLPLTSKTQFSRRRSIVDRAVGELCGKTIDGSFNKTKTGTETLYEPWTFLQEYFQSFMIGMMTCLVSTMSEPNYEPRTLGWHSKIRKETFEQVKYNWTDHIKNNLNEELQMIQKVIFILQKQFIPTLNDIKKMSQVQDEVAYEIHVHLSKMPEVRSFGIEDKVFTVYVDSEWLNDNYLLQRLERVVLPHYDFDKSSILEWIQPVFHGELIQGENEQCGMITTFAERLDMNGENKWRSLYFITCAHLAPEKELPVFLWMRSNCTCADRSRLIDCKCRKVELGVNKYPFDTQRENPFDAVIDITCGIVNRNISEDCNRNVCGPHSRPIEIVDSSTSIDDNTGKTVLKWDCNGNEQRGEYSGVQFRTDYCVPRRVDIIKSVENAPFGTLGHSGALSFLVENQSEEKDSMSPTFVYLGKWSENKYMCFRLQEGLECLEMAHNLKLRLCLDMRESRR